MAHVLKAKKRYQSVEEGFSYESGRGVCYQIKIHGKLLLGCY